MPGTPQAIAGNTHEKPRPHDTSRIAWAKLMARVGEEFPLECPNCRGDIRLIAFITEPGPIRKILTHLGEPFEPPSVSPARGPPTDWGELVQAHDDREAVQASPDELPAIDIHSLWALPGTRHQRSRRLPDSERLRADARKTPPHGGSHVGLERLLESGRPRPQITTRSSARKRPSTWLWKCPWPG